MWMNKVQFPYYLIFRTSQGEGFCFCNITFGVRMEWLSSLSSQTEPLDRKFSFQLQDTVGKSKAHHPQNGLFERFERELIHYLPMAQLLTGQEWPLLNPMIPAKLSQRALTLYSTGLLIKGMRAWGWSWSHAPLQYHWTHNSRLWTQAVNRRFA